MIVLLKVSFPILPVLIGRRLFQQYDQLVIIPVTDQLVGILLSQLINPFFHLSFVNVIRTADNQGSLRIFRLKTVLATKFGSPNDLSLNDGANQILIILILPAPKIQGCLQRFSHSLARQIGYRLAANEQDRLLTVWQAPMRNLHTIRCSYRQLAIHINFFNHVQETFPVDNRFFRPVFTIHDLALVIDNCQ